MKVRIASVFLLSSFASFAHSIIPVMNIPDAHTFRPDSFYVYFDVSPKNEARIALIAHDRGPSQPEAGIAYFTTELEGLTMVGNKLMYNDVFCGERINYAFQLSGRCTLDVDLAEGNSAEVSLKIN